MYRLTQDNRKSMHEELDRIIDYINTANLDEGNCLPDLMIELTKVDKHEVETITRIGVEFVESVDNVLEVEARFHNVMVDEYTGEYNVTSEWEVVK